MPKRILVVDDTSDARELLQSLLELEHFEVVQAADGVEGYEQACSQSPDLIITDLSMPNVSGLDLIRKLRSTPDFKALPILAVTSHGMDKAVEAIRAGADRALARPVENHLLLAFVFDLLGKAKRQTPE